VAGEFLPAQIADIKKAAMTGCFFNLLLVGTERFELSTLATP
jgi:hypothetical protein